MKVTASAFDFFTNREFHMTKNIGDIERIVRIVGGLVLIALAATGTVGVWGWLGLVPLATGLAGWCPPYSLLGINTCKNKNT
jgi:O-antigen ligase